MGRTVKGRLAATLMTKFLLIVALASLLHFRTEAQGNRGVSVQPGNRQIGLVIGNENYPAKSVAIAGNDAQLIERALGDLGFHVTKYLDTRLADLEKAVDRIVSEVRRGDTVVIYYSGFCLGIGAEDYFVPVDFVPKDAADAKYTAYSVSRLLDRLEASGAATTVLFLDASRKNPFGLGEPVQDTPVPISGGATAHIVLAAAPGKTSMDLPDSRNGLFAGFVADALHTPGLTIGEIFTSLQEKVYAASGGLQTPTISSGADTRTVLAKEGQSGVQGASSDGKHTGLPFESELKAWQKVQQTSSDSTILEFMTNYPDGSFYEAASKRLRKGPSNAVTGGATTAASSLIVPEAAASSKIEKMAKVVKPEVDPNFEFNEADLDFLIQADAMEKRLERDGMIDSTHDLEEYLNQVGQSVLPTLTPPARVRWRFRVLRDPTPNAFALPNGSIFVNAGLLGILENESQLAGVLAHEATHVIGRHGLYFNRDYRKKSTGISLVQMVAAYAPTGSDLTSISIRASANAAAVLVPAILNASILGYSRELERNADLYAVEKLFDSGYDPHELVNAFRHLDEKNEVQLQTVYYSDHPKLLTRIAYVEAAIVNKSVSSSPVYVMQAKRYQNVTRKVRLQNIAWTYQAGRRRTALILAHRMVSAEPDSADAMLALADTYRALGPWSADAHPGELSDRAKKDALKTKAKLTPQEEEARVMQSAEGQAAWTENKRNAEELYRKVLVLDPSKSEAYRSLGLLYEKSGELANARECYLKFVAAVPEHPDAPRIQRKISSLGESLSIRK